MQVILFNMKNFQTKYSRKAVWLLCLVGLMLVSFQGFAQSGKSSTQLKKDKQKIENEIANTQKLLKKTESNQKAAVQQAALLRQQIDDCDHELLAVLARRMSVSREIGEFKKANNLRVMQPQRYQNVLKNRLAEGERLSLDSDFVRRIMQAIHEESVRQQLDLFKE